MTITVSLLSSSIASLTVSNGSSPQVAKKWLDLNALAVFVPTPAWQGSALSRRSRSALFHLCMFVDSGLIWQKAACDDVQRKSIRPRSYFARCSTVTWSCCLPRDYWSRKTHDIRRSCFLIGCCLAHQPHTARSILSGPTSDGKRSIQMRCIITFSVFVYQSQCCTALLGDVHRTRLAI